tara:strand:- start:2880 stop:3386 length:507 start_codon:yes stop_codon:yes gene_type:complete
MMKIVTSIAAMLWLCACAAEEERDLIFNRELLVSQGLPDIEHSGFTAQWQCFFTFAGKLEDAPDPNSEEIEGLRFSPILFYPKDSFLAVTTKHDRLHDKQSTRLSFFCEPRSDVRIELEHGHIYLFESSRREVREIGKFASDASPEEIVEIAKRALKRSIEQAEALKP